MHREISVARCALVALGAALVASAVLRLPLFSAANPNDRLYAWNVTYDPPKTDETVALGTLHGGAFSPLADCFPRKYVSGHASCFGGWNPTTALHSLSDFDAADLHFWLTSVNVSRLACTGNLNCSVDLNMYIADNGASLVATAISFVKPASLAGCFVFDTLTAKYSLVVLLRPSTAADSTCMNEGAQTFDSRLFVGMASGDDYAFLWAVDAVESRLYKVWPATGKLEGIGCSLGISVPHPSVVRDQALFYNLTSRELFYSIATNGTTTVWEIDVQTGEVIDNMWNISNANLQGMAMTTFDPPVSHDAGDPMCPGDAGNEAYVPAGVAALFALSGIGETIFRLDVLPPTGFQQNQSSLCSNTMISTLVGDTETGNDQLFFSVVSSGLLWTVDTSTCSISYMSLSGTCPTFLEVVLCSTWSISLGKLLVITYQTMFGNSLYAIDVHELKCTYLGMIVDSLARDIYVMGIAEIDKVLFILDPSFGGGDAELFVLDPCLCMAYSNASLGTSFDVDSPISMDYDNRTHYLFIHASNTSKLKAGYHGEIFSYSVATESLRPVLQLSNDTYCISTISCPVYDLPSLSSSHSFSDQSSSTSLSLSSSTSGSFSSSLSTSISESISKSVSQSSSVSTSTSASESSSESISTSESTSKSTSNSHSVSVLESSSQQSSSSSLSTPPLSVFVSSQSSQESLPSFSAVLLSSEDKKDEKSLALIIGLTVSLGGAFFIGMAVFAFLFVLRKKRQHVSRDYDLDTLHGSSSNSASHISAGSAAKEAVRLSRLCRHDSTIDLDGFRQVHAEEFPLQVEPEATLDFGLGGHQAAVGVALTQDITMQNKTKKPVFMKACVPRSHKYNVDLSLSELTVKAGQTTTLTVTLTILCTTKLDSEVLIQTFKGTEGDRTPDLLLPLKIKVDSMLSSSLDYEELHLCEPAIGEGSFGIVYKGDWRGQEVAVKMIKNQQAATEEFFSEVRTLEAIRCPQIVHFIGSVKTNGKFSIVTEFFELGSLHHCMKKYPFSLPLKIKCLLDCSRGMNFLHQSQMLHRDLKTENLLVATMDIAATVNCKITDFGTTRDISRPMETQLYTTGIGTPSFMPPELLANGKYKETADVYSFSIIMWQVATEQEPYTQFTNVWKIVDHVTAGNRLPLDGIPEGLTTLITRCWAQDQHDRPLFPEICTYLEAQFAKAKSHD